MIYMSTTDGSVAAGGNTLIMQNCVLTFLSLFTFSSSDISPGDWERPISVTDLFWTLGLGVLGVAEKSVNPCPDSATNSKTFLCGPGCFSPYENHILSLLSDTHHDLQKAVASNHPEIIQVSFRAVWNGIFCFVLLFCVFSTQFCVRFVCGCGSIFTIMHFKKEQYFLVVADWCH